MRQRPGNHHAAALRRALLRLLAAGHPEEYWDLDAQQLVERVAVAREKLGLALVVLGHHYQREDIIQFADFRGDSFKLSQWAAEQPESEYIVFCGVHFMAEAADILSAPHQKVMLPNMAAGCSMADMADPDDVYAAWEELEEAGVADKVVPVTYMNSAASLKAFCGKHGGIVCTSSNAERCCAGPSSAARRCFSSRTSTSAATPAPRWACRWTR